MKNTYRYFNKATRLQNFSLTEVVTSSVVTAVYQNQIEKLTVDLPYTIDFKNGFGDCIVEKVSGNAEWEKTGEGASIDGYNKGTCESWIITPAVTVKDLSFNFVSGTQNQGPVLQLLYSANYDSTMNDPNKATWVNITDQAEWPVASGGAVKGLSSGNIELKGLSSPIRIAFKYTGNNDSAALWLVGTLKITDITRMSEVTPENIDSIPQLAQDVTASGDWTQGDIDELALRIADNLDPIASIKFTGSVTSDSSDEILLMSPNSLKIFADGVAVPDAWTDNVVTLDAEGNATSANIVLDAGFFFGTPVKIKADKVSFLRDGMVPGNKSTIYLPFACTLPEGVEAYTFSGVEGNTVSFGMLEGTTLAANTPYLIVASGENLSIDETNVEILPEPEAAPETGYAFLGTYRTISALGFYGFKDNSFKVGVEGATVQAFRAYIKPSSSNSAPSILNINILDDGLTGVKNATQEENVIYAENGVVYIQTDKAGVIAVYDLEGKLMRSAVMTEGRNAIEGLAPGMYIINNRKITVE